MLVVASPDHIARMEIRTPVDLARCTLLRSDDESWALWFAHAELDWPEPNLGLFFEELALPRRSLADDALRPSKVFEIHDIRYGRAGQGASVRKKELAAYPPV